MFGIRTVAPLLSSVLALSVSGVTPAGAAGTTLQCEARVPGVTARGVPVTLHYDGGRASTQRRGPGRLGYQPRDLAYPHPTTTGPATYPSTSYWFTVSGSQLREVTEVDRRDDQGRLVASYRTRVVRKHWENVRQIAIGRGRARLYVLSTDDQLLRYKLRGKGDDTRVQFEEVVGAGFGSIGSFEYVRTITALGLRTDVFLATNADTGQLLEYAIPKENPSSYSVSVLADTGWWDMRVASRQASCVDPRNGRAYGAIVGVGVDGAVQLWTDLDPADGDGSDIAPWGVLKPSWQPLAYSD
jgi:hypothetical protein